jgi:hypothetical protein
VKKKSLKRFKYLKECFTKRIGEMCEGGRQINVVRRLRRKGSGVEREDRRVLT